MVMNIYSLFRGTGKTRNFLNSIRTISISFKCLYALINIELRKMCIKKINIFKKHPMVDNII